MEKTTLKSIGAIFAGFMAVLILSIVTDMVLERAGVFPPPTEPAAYTSGMLLVALCYRCAFGVVGGFGTAALAPGRPVRHAIILGSIGTVFAALGAVANWDKTNPSTEWYPILLVVLTLPSVWIGGKLKARRTPVINA